MKDRILYLILGLAIQTGFTSCEKVEFPETGQGGTGASGLPEDTLVVDGTGEGSMNAPATVADVLERTDEFLGTSCWVAGYIVGYTERTMKNAAFTADGAVQSNILLADVPWEQEAENCVPVELKTDKWKEKLSLAHCPDNLGKRVGVHGLIKTYFSVPGVRSMDQSYWMEEEEFPDVPSEPEEPEEPSDPDGDQEPNVPEDRPEEPETPDDPETPEEPDEEEFGDPRLLYVNEVLLQLVDRNSALCEGERYMLGTVADREGAVFVASSVQYGLGIKYRRVLKGEMSGDRIRTEQGIAPAVFVLERSERGYRLKDELTGGYLAYDVRGDASSVSWLPLYTLLSEDLNASYRADFLIETTDLSAQLSTAEKIKFSSVDSRNCGVRYNSGGENFKLNYGKNGASVCLYLMK